MRGNLIAVIFLTLVALTSSCGSNPPALSEQQESAIQFNQRGETAFRQGDYAGALAEYQQALSAYRSIENVNGIAIELINLSLVYRRLGDKAKSQDALDQVLTGSSLDFSPTHRAEAAYRKAGYALEDGNEAEARAWTDKALAYCGECRAAGRLYNLKARLSLAENPQDAIAYARRAVAFNKTNADKIEEANSLRLIADASLQSGDFITAQQSYDEALRLDKETGSTAKIVLDLMGLGRSLARQDKRNDAAEYFQRAYSVAEGAGDAKTMNEIAIEMKRLAP